MTEEKRDYLLTTQEACDLRNALDVLCDCYAGGVDSPEVKDLLKRYACGTTAGTRARRLFRHIDNMARTPLTSLEAP
jgi:hypothetical protein